MTNFLNNELIFIKNNMSEQNIYLLIFIFFTLVIFNRLKSKGYFFALIALPGTFFHELSHYIVSLLTFGMPTKLSIIPYKSKNGMTLGYVESRNITWFNGLLIGLAPLLLIPVSYFIFKYFLINEGILLNKILIIYLIANLLEASIPSIQDIKVALQSQIPLIIFISVFGYLYIIFN